MNTRHIAVQIATVAAALVGFAAATAANAQSGEASYDYPMAHTSTLTRAEVLAAAQQARVAGLIPHGDKTVVEVPMGTQKTHAQVAAETLEAIRIGAIDRHEQSVSPTLMQLEQIRMAGERAAGMTVAAR